MTTVAWAWQQRSKAGRRVEWFKDDATGQMKMREVEGSEFEIKADLLAMGSCRRCRPRWSPGVTATARHRRATDDAPT